MLELLTCFEEEVFDRLCWLVLPVTENTAVIAKSFETANYAES